MRGQKIFNGLFLVILILAVSSMSYGTSDMTKQGVAFIKAQRFNEAIKILSKAIKDSPNDTEAIHYRGMARYYQGDIDGAIADYSRALEISPQLTEVLTSRGVALFRKGNYAQARKDLTRAYSKNPNDTNALNQMAWMLAVCPDKRYRDGNKALDFSRKAIQIKTTPNYLDTLAAAYAETGRYEEAIRVQRKVIALLSQEERLNNIEIYLKRLKKYEAHQPWRQTGERGDNTSSKTAEVKKIKVIQPPPSKTTGKPAATVTTSAKKQTGGTGLFPYTIFISTYQNPDISAQKVLSLQKRGDPAFLSHAYFKSTGHWYQVYYGWFKNAASAARMAGKLKKRKFRKSIVVKKPYAVQVIAAASRATLKKAAARLRALKYPSYQVPDPGTGKTRLLIGAYSTQTVPDKLIETLGKAGFKPMVVLR